MKFKGGIDALMWYQDNMESLYAPPVGTNEVRAIFTEDDLVLDHEHKEAVKAEWANEYGGLGKGMRPEDERDHIQYVKPRHRPDARAGYDREDRIITMCDLTKIIAKKSKSEQRVYAAIVIGGMDYAFKKARDIFGTVTKVGNKARGEKVRNVRRTPEWFEERVWRAVNSLEDSLLEHDYLNPLYHYARPILSPEGAAFMEKVLKRNGPKVA